MSVENDSKSLPLNFAIKYLNENGYVDTLTKINEIDPNISSRERRMLIKGMFIDDIETKGMFRDFCEKYWGNGLTDDGIKRIRNYKKKMGEILNQESNINEGTDGDDGYSNVNESSFAYEADLRDYLAINLGIIEKGLVLYKSGEKDGVEYSVDTNNKRIDILAIDKDNVPVIIELKVNSGYERVIGQCQYYKNKIKSLFNVDKARVVIIAKEITDYLKTASLDLEGFELFEYELK
jgi:hypothetical protein